MLCPIQCGKCCSYWRDVKSLAGDTETCPNLSSKSCRLTHKQRPLECSGFLCDEALMFFGHSAYEHICSNCKESFIGYGYLSPIDTTLLFCSSVCLKTVGLRNI